MEVVITVISIIMILVAIVLIASVLMQEGSREGLGTIGGGAETFFGKNKAKSYEGKLVLLTKVTAGVFIVLAIVMTRLVSVKGASADEPSSPAPTAAVDEDLNAELDAIDDATADIDDEDGEIEDETESTDEPTDEATEAPTDEATEEPADEATDEPQETEEP